MLQNAYFLAKIGADAAENERHFAEFCQKLATILRGAGAGAGHREERARLEALGAALPRGAARRAGRGDALRRQARGRPAREGP